MLLAAGGTGGHLFPAEALAHELVARGYEVHLATDARAAKYSGSFPASEIHYIASATIFGRSPVVLAGAGLALLRGYLQSRRLVRKLWPVTVIGFGGYPTVPPVLAAVHAGVPALIHDSNAVMGRANRLLAPRVGLVAMGFEAGVRQGKAVITGNPVRPAVIEAAKIAYGRRKAGDPFHLLVFGGSQGAQFFSNAMPEAIALLDEAIRRQLRIVHQARPEDQERVVARYRELGTKAEVAPFFTDLPKRIADAHLVIARGGAGTVGELAVIGRPGILVPLPHAIDQDQQLNAQAMVNAGAAFIEPQKDLTRERLANLLSEAVAEPERLASMAEKAKKTGKPDAAARLADCVEHVAKGGRTNDFEGQSA